MRNRSRRWPSLVLATSAKSPLYIWDPRSGVQGERRQSLVKTIDLAPTLLEFFDVEIPGDMTGRPLRDTITLDTPVRQAALFGLHGGHVNCTDGRYVYMRAPAGPENGPLYNYTLMPTHMRTRFSVEELQNIELAPPFAFTKGVFPDENSLGVLGPLSSVRHNAVRYGEGSRAEASVPG